MKCLNSLTDSDLNIKVWILLMCSVCCAVGCKTQRNEAGEFSTDYLIKWQGLPYSCCTEEDGMLIDRLFPKAVDEYNCCLRSACTPNKLCRVGLCLLDCVSQSASTLMLYYLLNFESWDPISRIRLAEWSLFIIS